MGPSGAVAATACGGACATGGSNVTLGGGRGQQSQAHGEQVSPGAQAGQAQAQPPPPDELPASTVEAGDVWAQTPVGHGVVRHSMLSEVQPHASVVSAVHEVASVCAEQGSAGVVPHPHGAQAAPAGQAGQPQTETGAEPVLPPLPLPVPVVPPLLAAGTVIVVVVPLLQEQLQAAQSAPTGHSGQLHVQVPDPPVPRRRRFPRRRSYPRRRS